MKRCAIYTRKSSEEGLDQEFNSLDSQRESAEYYIKSQAHQGWEFLTTRYDDGGYSGGNIERPSLQRLLKDIQSGAIDIIVVYKIDRLSRSMTDFIKIMEVFDAHNVTFVSVTQHFDTNTSMGRLTLNILQSFSQFEREMTTERIRDKIAASKRKGMWLGGIPPLGYDIQNKKLVINPNEEKIIKFIFDEFLENQSVTSLIVKLEISEFRTKSWTSRDGKIRGNRTLDKGSVYGILKNILYVGKIRHKAQIYDGEHAPIIEAEKFERVQTILKENQSNGLTATKSPYLLKGLVFDEDGYAMTCAASKKATRRYRYYTSTRAIKKSYKSSKTRPISAYILENAIINIVNCFATNPEFIERAFQENGDRDEITLSHEIVFKNSQDFKLIWSDLSLKEQQEFIKALIKSIKIFKKYLEITFHGKRMNQYMITQHRTYPSEGADVTCKIPIELWKKDGRRLIKLKLGATPGGNSENSPNELLSSIALGTHFLKELNKDPSLTFSKLAKIEKIDPSDLAKYIRLTQISPLIIERIFKGDLSYASGKACFMQPFPNSWQQQEMKILNTL